jgi:hypothetical protein
MKGRVTDSKGNGLTAVVYVSDINGKPMTGGAQVLADERGYFSLPDFSVYGFYVSAAMTGWNTETKLAAYSDLDFRLTPGDNILPEVEIIEDKLKKKTNTLLIISLIGLGLYLLSRT